MVDARAKDLLSTLKSRRTLGDRIMARVGFRAWERPRVAVSDRIFKLYRLHDPFDPNSPQDEDNVGLGPVTLRLGDKKRQPAPHALPKEEKKPALPKVPPAGAPPGGAPAPRAPAPATPSKPATPAPPPSGEQPFGYTPKQYAPKNTTAIKPATPPPSPVRPQAPPSPARPQPAPVRPTPPPAAKAPPAPPEEPGRSMSYIPKQYDGKKKTSSSGSSAPPPKPVTSTGSFGPRVERPGLVGKLPVRPEVQAQNEVRANPAPSAVKQVAIPAEGARRSVSSGGGSVPKGMLTRGGRLSLGAATVVTTESEADGPEVIEVVRVTAPRPEPARAVEPVRVVEQPVRVVEQPVRVVEQPARVESARPAPPAPPPRSEPVLVAPPAPKPPPPAPKPPPRPPMPGQKSGDGLDDLFAASAQEGRMRIGKAKAVTGVAAADTPEAPKRNPVSLPKPVLPGDLPKAKPGDG